MFDPSDPGFAGRIRRSFAKQSAMATLGLTLDRVEAGLVTLSMPFAAHIRQQHGYVHAGVLTSGMDSAAGYAALTLMQKGAEVLTIEFKANFLSPAKGDRFEMIGKVIKPGRTITVCDAEAWAISGAQRKMVARLAATMISVHPD